MPLSFGPGKTFQFDWSREIVVIAGVTTRTDPVRWSCATITSLDAGAPAREVTSLVRDARKFLDGMDNFLAQG